MKKNVLIFSAIAFVIIGLGIVGLVLSKNKDVTNNDNNNDTTNPVVEKIIDEEKYNLLSTKININNTADADINKTELDKNLDLVKKLYVYTLITNNRFDNYQDTKVTINDISKEAVLTRSFRSILCEENISGRDITQTALKNKIKQMYKTNTVTDYSHIEEISPAGSWTYLNGKYVGVGAISDHCVYYEDDNNKIVKVTTDDKNIYMYTELYYLTSIVDEYNLYADYNGYLNNEKINYKDMMNYPGASATYSLTNYIKDNYPNLIYTYKHIFTKDSKGNYYWVSSEPLQK